MACSPPCSGATPEARSSTSSRCCAGQRHATASATAYSECHRRRGRIAAVLAHLSSGEQEAPPAPVALCGPDNIDDPAAIFPPLAGTPEHVGAGRNMNSPLGEAVQGYGIIRHHPPPFDPSTQFREALNFYRENGYVVVNSLSGSEVSMLNSVCDEWVHTRGSTIDVPGQGQLFFPLLNYPEVDFTVVHPATYPMVKEIMGGADKPRLIEFNYRGWEPETTETASHREDGSFAPRPRGMSWHPDGVPNVSLEERATRRPYGPPDLLSTFTYLTDVDESTPAFAVIPKSRRCRNIQELKRDLGADYCEVPIYGPAGTTCIVDRVTIVSQRFAVRYTRYTYHVSDREVCVCNGKRLGSTRAWTQSSMTSPRVDESSIMCLRAQER